MTVCRWLGAVTVADWVSSGDGSSGQLIGYFGADINCLWYGLVVHCVSIWFIYSVWSNAHNLNRYGRVWPYLIVDFYLLLILKPSAACISSEQICFKSANLCHSATDYVLYITIGLVVICISVLCPECDWIIWKVHHIADFIIQRRYWHTKSIKWHHICILASVAVHWCDNVIQYKRNKFNLNLWLNTNEKYQRNSLKC